MLSQGHRLFGQRVEGIKDTETFPQRIPLASARPLLLKVRFLIPLETSSTTMLEMKESPFSCANNLGLDD